MICLILTVPWYCIKIYYRYLDIANLMYFFYLNRNFSSIETLGTVITLLHFSFFSVLTYCFNTLYIVHKYSWISMHFITHATISLIKIFPVYISFKSRDISVGIATGYGLDGQSSIPGEGKRFFYIPQRSDRLWGQPSFLSSGYRGLFPRW
jgi:hypothetical protein